VSGAPAVAAPAEDALERMAGLVSPYGLVSRVSRLPVGAGEPNLNIHSGFLGDAGQLSGATRWVHDPNQGNFDGAGGDLDPTRAAHLAVAESLERYSSTVVPTERLRWATARELGGQALDLASFPSCSASELADPRCGLLPPDPDAPLRWVRGWSFTRGQEVWVPAVAVWLRMPALAVGERFLNGVSTGCAVHGDPVAACVNGLLEVLERDAISMTWLQRLPHPEVDLAADPPTGPAARVLEHAGRQHLPVRAFDATTDVGVPVLYAVQQSQDPRLAHLVAATCELDPQRALAKLHRELASLRIALRHVPDPEVTDAADVSGVCAGALVAGRAENAGWFHFLLGSDRRAPRPTTTLTAMGRASAHAAAAEPREQLRWLVDRLDDRGMEAVAVDLTTAEARSVGATVVRMVVPQAMPLSFVHRARYLATPRLYTAPLAMGHRAAAEEELNHNPQPFA